MDERIFWSGKMSEVLNTPWLNTPWGDNCSIGSGRSHKGLVAYIPGI